ncbi:GAF domain-containing protein [Cognatishimia sp.]|uniref:GAF domain-containing protein n=1 Tax=Cognatishimia sp. TaxID=2211648 RepID=UPI0035187E75|nr:GAF domain-containing protein [Cognatishimia sp.]
MSGEVSILKMIRSTLYADLASVSRTDLRPGYFSHIVDTDASPMAEKFESPFLSTTCCAAVIDSQEPLIMEGLKFDDNLPQCPMMKAEGLKAYIGVPIYANDLVVGAVEAICREPRVWSTTDLEHISKFARLIETLMPIEGQEVHVPKLRLVN